MIDELFYMFYENDSKKERKNCYFAVRSNIFQF